MSSDNQNAQPNEQSSTRRAEFAIKRSRTKVLSSIELDLPLKSSKRTPRRRQVRRKSNLRLKCKEKVNRKSEQLKRRLKLIEDYFYPETSSPSINPADHEPIIDISQMLRSVEERKHRPRPTLNYLEGSMALKEVQANKALLNCSITQTIKKIVKIDEGNISSFENWNKDTAIAYLEDVKGDIKRSRIRDSTEKEAILEDLKQVIIFYCENDTIKYQQGMQDIFIPFVYLKSNEFSLAEVYAYSKGYIDMFMPNTLHSKFNGKDYSLPHLQWQLSLLKMLLKYHDIELHNHFQSFEIEIEAFATPWILTQFSRVVDFSLIYEFIEIILFEKDQFMALYMTIALLKFYRSQILELDAIELLLPFLQRKLKISNVRELCQIYYESVALRSRTPLSFVILIQKLKINDRTTVISNEEMRELQELELETFVVYPDELLLHQKIVTNCCHLFNASNNDKSMNKFYTTSNQNKYVTCDQEVQDQRDLHSITSINILKRDWGNDTEIGKNVKFMIIDLTLKKKTQAVFPDSIVLHGVKGKSALEVLESLGSQLGKYNILIITSDTKGRLDKDEKARLAQTLEDCTQLGLSRVSVLKGGLKHYLPRI